MKKIIFVIGESKIAGTELQTLNLSRRIGEIDQKVELWMLSEKGVLNTIVPSALMVRNIPIVDAKIQKKIVNFYKLMQLMKKEKKAIFHTQLPMPSLTIFAANYFIRKKHIQVVGIRGKISNHGLISELMIKKTLQASAKIICNSDHLVKETMKRFSIPKKKIAIIHNGVERPKKIANQNSQQISAVVLANFISYKRHEGLLESIPKLKNPVHFTFYGEGKIKDKIIKQVKEMGLEKTVTFAKSQDKNKDFLAEFQFGVHPSETEGLSNAILEEISYGLPVVAINVGGNHHLVKNNINGLLLDEFNPESFAKAIDYLSGSVEIRKKMGKESIDLSHTFNWEKCVNQHLKCYKSVVNQ